MFAERAVHDKDPLSQGSGSNLLHLQAAINFITTYHIDGTMAQLIGSSRKSLVDLTPNVVPFPQQGWRAVFLPKKNHGFITRILAGGNPSRLSVLNKKALSTHNMYADRLQTHVLRRAGGSNPSVLGQVDLVQRWLVLTRSLLNHGCFEMNGNQYITHANNPDSRSM